MVNQGQPGGNQQGGNQAGNQPAGNQPGGNQVGNNRQYEPTGGYFRYRCMYFWTRNCDSWIWVNKAVCASCLADGFSGETVEEKLKRDKAYDRTWEIAREENASFVPLNSRFGECETKYRKAKLEKEEAWRSLLNTKFVMDRPVWEPFAPGLKESDPKKYERIAKSHYKANAEIKAEAEERYPIDCERYNKSCLAFEKANESFLKIKQEVSQYKIRAEERINAPILAYTTSYNPSSSAVNNPSNNLSSNSNSSVTGRG